MIILQQLKFLRFFVFFAFILSTKYLIAQDSFLDPSFGNNGKVVYDKYYSGLSKTSTVLSTQSDGKIILGGRSLKRLNPDGSLDTTFGVNGYINKITVALTEDGENYEDYEINFVVSTIAINEDNSLIVAFKPETSSWGALQSSYYWIKKFSANGIIDDDFNYDSENNYDIFKDVSKIISLPNGKVLIGGFQYQLGIWSIGKILKQLNVDGSVDSSFSTDYYFPFAIGISDIISQNDGKFLLIGNRRDNEYGYSSFCGRLNADGSTDVFFGDLGFKNLMPNYSFSSVNSLAVLNNNNILLTGYFKDTSNLNNYRNYTLKFDSTGTPVANFGNNGLIFSSEHSNSPSNVQRILIDQEQNVYLIYTHKTLKKIAIDKIDENGALVSSTLKGNSTKLNEFYNFLKTETGDLFFLYSSYIFNESILNKTNANFDNISSFGSSGFVSFIAEEEFDNCTISSSLLQPNGKTLVTGNFTDSVIKRFNADGSEDVSFNYNSRYVEFNPNSTFSNVMNCQSNNKILIANFDGTRYRLYRLNENGTLDTTFGVGGQLNVGFSVPVFQIIVSQNDDFYVVVEDEPAEFIYPPTYRVYKRKADGSFASDFGSCSFSFYYKHGVIHQDNLYFGGHRRLYSGLNNYHDDFIIHKRLPNGASDNTFGNNGTVITTFPNSSSINKLHITNSNQIIAIGHAGYTAIAKYNLNGNLDTNYGILGKNTIPQFHIDSALSSDGSINLATRLYWNSYPPQNYNAFKLTHINSQGFLNTNFGDNGEIITEFDFGSGSSHSYPVNIMVQPDNKIVVVGRNGKLLLSRYNSIGLGNENYIDDYIDVKVYPNPFVNHVNIKINDEFLTNDPKISFYDSIGKQIMISNLNISNRNIEVSMPENLAKGYYFLKIEIGKLSKIIKLIK
jgi:uncharacterized delta-60 repeat protein